MFKFLFNVTIALFFSAVLSAQVNYPFPQNVSYPNGNNLVNVNTAKLKTDFETWWGNFYEEKDELGRIKFDDRTATVSEGIGYGMLLTVYMSDNSTSYKSEFDKLWAYYNNFLDDNELMHWRIEGFEKVTKENAATDAELDVAVALITAYYQYGEEKYKTDALELLAKIKEHEVDDNFILKPGDVWNDKKNPSYFSYFGLGLFAEFDTANKEFWNKVIDASFQGVLENQSSAGISSDWYNPANPKDNLGTDLGYDAIRTPWRVALGYAWYGGTDAELYLDRVLKTFGNAKPNIIKDKIKYSNGSIIGTYNNATFVGGIGSIFMRSSSYSEKLNEYYTNLENQEYDINNVYFGGALDILYRLTLSGNFPNLHSVATSIENKDVRYTTEEIKLYPNPAISHIKISAKAEAEIEICDITGKVVIKEIGNKIDVNELSSGLYFCIVKENGIQKTIIKFNKQ